MVSASVQIAWRGLTLPQQRSKEAQLKRWWKRAYLEFDVRANVLARVGVIKEVQDGGDECLIDAAELAVDDVLEDGAETTPLGHHHRVFQGYWGRQG